MSALPTHPTLRHPLTGAPLRVVYVDRHGRARWPIMGAAEEGGEGGGGGNEPSGGEGGGQQNAEPEFPANTPVADMEPAQQTAYWKHQAKKHETRVKAYGGLTTDELAELRQKAERQDALEDELASDKDKAVKQERSTVEAEQAAKYQPMLAETAFRVAIGDRKPTNEVDDFIADLNLTRFINDDGQVDTAKVLSRVEQFAPAKGNQQQRGPVIPGVTPSSGNNGSGGGSVAEVMAQRRAAREQKS